MQKKVAPDILILLQILCLSLIDIDPTTTIPYVTSFQTMSNQQSIKKRSTWDGQNREEVLAPTTTTALNAIPTIASTSTENQQHVYTSRSFKPRYTGPPEDSMTEEQKQIRQVILETRPRTGLSGPFGPWLAVPDIANPAQLLGRACRYGTSLSFRESELVILFQISGKLAMNTHASMSGVINCMINLNETNPFGASF